MRAVPPSLSAFLPGCISLRAGLLGEKTSLFWAQTDALSFLSPFSAHPAGGPGGYLVVKSRPPAELPRDNDRRHAHGGAPKSLYQWLRTASCR